MDKDDIIFNLSSFKLKKKYLLFKLKYQIDKNRGKKIRLFGEIFAKRNKLSYKIIYNNRIYNMKDYLENISKK